RGRDARARVGPCEIDLGGADAEHHDVVGVAAPRLAAEAALGAARQVEGHVAAGDRARAVAGVVAAAGSERQRRREPEDRAHHAFRIRGARPSQRAFALARSPSRWRAAPRSGSAASSRSVAAAMSSTARVNAGSSWGVGFARPLTLRTYWSAASRISARVV